MDKTLLTNIDRIASQIEKIRAAKYNPSTTDRMIMQRVREAATITQALRKYRKVG